MCDYTFGLDKNKVLIPVPKKEKPTKKKVVTGKKTKAKVMKRPSDDDDFELGTPRMFLFSIATRYLILELTMHCNIS